MAVIIIIALIAHQKMSWLSISTRRDSIVLRPSSAKRIEAMRAARAEPPNPRVMRYSSGPVSVPKVAAVARRT